MILGIDPSFTGTGLALVQDNLVLDTLKIKQEGVCYHNIVENHNACEKIVSHIDRFLSQVQDLSSVSVSVEYPALATRSGAYLAILNGFLASYLKSTPIKEVIWFPPTAVNSFTKNKSRTKTHLVEWCLTNKFVAKRINHDIATAIILTQMLNSVKLEAYKNAYFLTKSK